MPMARRPPPDILGRIAASLIMVGGTLICGTMGYVAGVLLEIQRSGEDTTRKPPRTPGAN